MKAAWSSREVVPENFTSALKSSAFISVFLTFLGSAIWLVSSKRQREKKHFAIHVVPLLLFRMAAGKGEKVFCQSWRKGNAAEWPWVIRCTLAVSSITSSPPGVTLECLKLPNGFLNVPFPPNKEEWGDKSDLWSDLVKQEVAKKCVVDQRHNCTNKGRLVCVLILLTCVCLLLVKSCPLSSKALERCAT